MYWRMVTIHPIVHKTLQNLSAESLTVIDNKIKGTISTEA